MGLMGWKLWFTSRLPSMGQLTAVYGVIVLMVYGWTIYWYLWKLPSWLYFLTLGELLVTFSYAMIVNFIESLLILLVPVLLSLLLPHHWFRERFVAQGVVMVVLLLIALMNYLNVITGLQDFPPGLGGKVLAAIIGIYFRSAAKTPWPPSITMTPCTIWRSWSSRLPLIPNGTSPPGPTLLIRPTCADMPGR